MIRTDRLELRPVSAEDTDELHALLLDEDVRRYLLDGSEMDRDWVESVIDDSVASFAARGLGLWAVREPGRPTIVGLTGYREFHEPPVLEILWALSPGCWKRGLAVEMAQAAIDEGFAHELDAIRASTDAPNEASVRVMDRLGMRFVRRCPGALWDEVHYVLDKSA